MDGKVALITGASSGIGRATAEVFAENGARVVVAARRDDELASLVSGIEGRLASAMELAEDEWDRAMDVNLKGPFLCMKHEARAMLDGGHGGAIVNVGSVNSFLGFATGSAYVASTHGLIGLTSCASAELAPQGIRVNLVCPGIIDTPMHHRARKLITADSR